MKRHKPKAKPVKTAVPANYSFRRFSKVSLKRALVVARQTNLPLDRITFDGATGNFSLIVGKDTGSSSKNEWDDVYGKDQAQARQ